MDETIDIEVKNLTKFYTLALLKSNKSVTGYFVLKKLKEDIDRTASPTYIYDFLNQLQSKKYIEEVKKSKTKRSKGYKLTDAGQEFINKVFNRFENIIDAAVQQKIRVCASCGVKLYENYYTDVIDNKEKHFCCKHCARAYKKN